MAKSLESMKDIKLVSYSKVKQIHPIKPTGDTTTIGLTLTSEQARDLGIQLLLGANSWENLKVTGFRGNSTVTVTSHNKKKGGKS